MRLYTIITALLITLSPVLSGGKVVASEQAPAEKLQGKAPTKCRTLQLASFAKALKIADGLHPGDNDGFSYRGRPLHVRVDSAGTIAHIGYALFTPEAAQMVGMPRFTDFMERYLLGLDLNLNPNNQTPEQIMAIDRVYLAEGRMEWLKDISPATPFSVRTGDLKGFMATWTLPQGVLTVSIPADCQLLIGADAEELEQNLIATLPTFPEVRPIDLVAVKDKRQLLVGGDGRGQLKGKPYLSPLISSTLYVEDVDSVLSLICSPDMATRSTTNVMLTGQSPVPLPIDLTVNCYGYRNQKLNVTLGQFLEFCRSEGCGLYFGIKSKSPEKVSGTLFAFNPSLAYNHVLSVEFPTEILQGVAAPLKATLYAYVPLHFMTDDFFYHDIKEQP